MTVLNGKPCSTRRVNCGPDANDENRLGTYIDVLQIHRLDRDVPAEEIMKALNDVVESGKVRYLGASSVCFSLNLPSNPLPYCSISLQRLT